jgi:hypothetical protein
LELAESAPMNIAEMGTPESLEGLTRLLRIQRGEIRMMRNRLCAVVFFLPLMTICTTATTQAADSCQPVFDALTKVATTPSHSYTTNTSLSGGSVTTGETVFADGQKYIRARGKWMHIPVTVQEALEQEKEKQEHGESACQFLRDETVNGEAAMLYSVHREYEEVRENGQMWVSKTSGLLLRVEEDVDNTGNKVKEHRSTRIEYGNIRPPM